VNLTERRGYTGLPLREAARLVVKPREKQIPCGNDNKKSKGQKQILRLTTPKWFVPSPVPKSKGPGGTPRCSLGKD
jgi:hypothetical protein